QVTVKDSDGNELGTGDVDEEGNYTVDLDSPAEEGDDLSVTQSQENEDGEKFESDPRNVTVQQDQDGSEGDIELDAPSVDEVIEGDENITGEGETGSKVIVRDDNGSELGTGEVDDEGNY